MATVTPISRKKQSGAKAKKKLPGSNVIKPPKCRSCGGANGKHKDTCQQNRCKECKALTAINGHLRDCSQHKGAKTSTVVKKNVTVNGNDSKLVVTPETPAAAPTQPYPVITVDAEDLTAFQRTIDRGDFSGDKQLKEKCDFQSVIGGKMTACPHIAAMSKVVKETCPECERSHKETVEKFCIGHGIQVWGGGAPSRLQTEMKL